MRICLSGKEQLFDVKGAQDEGEGSGRIYQFLTNGAGLKRRAGVRRDEQKKSPSHN
jgi:hypothetical protein